jgi:hypothetical protein
MGTPWSGVWIGTVSEMASSHWIHRETLMAYCSTARADQRRSQPRSLPEPGFAAHLLGAEVSAAFLFCFMYSIGAASQSR